MLVPGFLYAMVTSRRISSRQGLFGLDAVIILGVGLLGMAAFLAILNLFIYTIIPTIPDVLTDVPTLYDYDVDGKRITDLPQVNDLPEEIRLQVEDLQFRSGVLQDELHTALESGNPDEQQRITAEINEINNQLADLDYGGFSQPNQRLEIYNMFAIPSMSILVLFIIFGIAGIYWEKGFGMFQKGTSVNIIKNSIIGIVAILVIPEFWDFFAIQIKQFSLYLMDPFNGDPNYMTQRLWCKMGCIVNFNEILDQNNWSTALSNPSNFGQALISSALLAPMKAVPTAMITITLFVIAKIRVIFIMIILLTLPVWMVAMNLPFLKKHGSDLLSNMVGASLSPPFSALTLFVGLSYIESNKNIASLEEWVSVLGIAVLAALWPVILAPKLSIIASTTTSMVQTALQSGAMLTSGAAAGMGGAMSSAKMEGGGVKDIMTKGLAGASMGTAQGMPGQMPHGMQQQMMGAVDNKLGTDKVSGTVSGINASNPTMTDPQVSNGMMHNPGNTITSLEGMDQGNAIINDAPQYNKFLDSQTSGVIDNQKHGAYTSLDQSYRNNPAKLNDDYSNWNKK